MIMMERDPSLDLLLELDGQVLVIDPETPHWVGFTVRREVASEAKPHGLDYSLTLHGRNGERLVGFHNAHPLKRGWRPGGKTNPESDHKHRLKTVSPYQYKDAATLLADFWSMVDAVLWGPGGAQ